MISCNLSTIMNQMSIIIIFSNVFCLYDSNNDDSQDFFFFCLSAVTLTKSHIYEAKLVSSYLPFTPLTATHVMQPSLPHHTTLVFSAFTAIYLIWWRVLYFKSSQRRFTSDVEMCTRSLKLGMEMWPSMVLTTMPSRVCLGKGKYGH